MTKEEQRITIAKICDINELVLPDYTNDLNAMHEAEKILDHSQKQQYNELLKGPNHDSYPFEASAQERAEAFLKVFKLLKTKTL